MPANLVQWPPSKQADLLTMPPEKVTETGQANGDSSNPLRRVFAFPAPARMLSPHNCGANPMKSHWNSKISRLGLLLGALGALEAQTQLLQTVLGPKAYPITLLALSVILPVLRQLTTAPVQPLFKSKKRKHQEQAAGNCTPSDWNTAPAIPPEDRQPNPAPAGDHAGKEERP